MSLPRTPSHVSIERRKCQRFPIRLDLHYRSLPADKPKTDSGSTCDISSHGLYFQTAGDPLPVGRRIEIFLDWPVRLDGHCPLQVRIIGRVTRNTADGLAILIDAYEFHTRSSEQAPVRYAAAAAAAPFHLAKGA